MADKPLKGSIAFVDRDAFEGPDGAAEQKKLEDAGAIVVKTKPGAKVSIVWSPPYVP